MSNKKQQPNVHRNGTFRTTPSVRLRVKSESPENKPTQARLTSSSNHTPKKEAGIVIFDTNIYLSHAKCVESFLKKGFDVFIPSMVLEELDVCKEDYKNREKTIRARAAQKKILQFLNDKHPRVKFSHNRTFSGLALVKQERPDSYILASVNWVLINSKRKSGEYAGYPEVIFVTNDIGLAGIATVLLGPKGLQVQNYREKKTKEKPLDIRSVRIASEKIFNRGDQQFYPLEGGEKIAENEAVMTLVPSKRGTYENYRIGVRKDKELMLVNPFISVCHFAPKPNGRPNWEQMLAIHYLMDKEVTCTILQGPAGTGKTFIALATALELIKDSQYDRISIYRPMVAVDKEGVGFLPGDEQRKVAPWMRPIFRNLEKILKKKAMMYDIGKLEKKRKKADKKGKGEKKNDLPSQFNGVIQGPEGLQLMSELKIDAEILSFTCGETIDNRIIIVDDAQNMTEQEFLNILTRVGENTKIIITGDLQQIHMKGLTKEQSGLYHAVNLLKGGSQVGIVNFTDETILRSEFVKFVVKKFSRRHHAA